MFCWLTIQKKRGCLFGWLKMRLCIKHVCTTPYHRHGWSRIFSGSLRSTLKLSVTAFAILFFSLLPLLCLTAAIGMRWETTETQWNFAVGMWSAVVLLSYFPNWKFYSFLPIKNRWSLAYPLGALFTVMFLSFALLKHWGFASTL